MDSATNEIKHQIIADMQPSITRAAKELAENHVQLIGAYQNSIDRVFFSRRNEDEQWDDFTTGSLDDNNPHIAYKYDNAFGLATVSEIFTTGGHGNLEITDSWIREEIEIRLKDFGAVSVKFSMSHTITRQ